MHILYVRALTDTCKLFQSLYYFAALFVLFVIYFELYNTNPITIASTHTTPTATTIHASASTMLSSYVIISTNVSINVCKPLNVYVITLIVSPIIFILVL